MSYLAHLPERCVLAVSGADRIKFLQGLVSNDVALAGDGTAIWSAYLTPQGRWLADFFVMADPDGSRLLLDCEAAQADDLAKRLTRFRLRADVQITLTDLAVHAAWGALPDAATVENAICAPDPRLEDAGWRLLLPGISPAANADDAAYDLHRLALGLPDGSRDCEPEKTLLLEANFDRLNGVSWTKGCYMGQELTARTHYRGLVRRRLVPVAAAGPLPPPGTVITVNGVEAGWLRSSRDHLGLAFLRPERIEGPLEADGVNLVARVPNWLAPALAPKEAAQGDA